jgi:2-dehydropantoate 2-reductase
MRIGVIGAGAVGGAVAALLARAGNEVEVTARGAHLESIREEGIRLAGGWGSYTATVSANEVLQSRPQLVIVATKAQDAVVAITANLAAVGAGVKLLVIQNGLDGIENAGAAAPDASVIGGLAIFASSYLSPGEVTVTTAGPLIIGGPAGIEAVADDVALVINAALPTRVTPNFAGTQWSKLVINQVNALPAITGLSAQDVISDSRLRHLMTLSIRENVAIGRANGIHFEKLQGLSDPLLRMIAAVPAWIGQLFPLLLRARIGPTPNPGSTLQSIRRGQVTEIDYLNGAVVRAATAVGRTAPVNATLVELVHEVERTGVFLAPDAVVARFSQ